MYETFFEECLQLFLFSYMNIKQKKKYIKEEDSGIFYL